LGSPDPSRTATIAARRGPGRIWVVTRSAQLQSGVSRLLPEYRKLFCQRTFASTDSGVDTANSASPGDTAPRNHLSVSKSRKINQISTITPNGHQTRSECCVPGSYPGVTPATRPDTGRLAPCRFHAEHRTGIQHHAIVSASASPAKSTRSVQSLQADNKRDRSAVSPGVTPATRPDTGRLALCRFHGMHRTEFACSRCKSGGRLVLPFGDSDASKGHGKRRTNIFPEEQGKRRCEFACKTGMIDMLPESESSPKTALWRLQTLQNGTPHAQVRNGNPGIVQSVAS